MKPMQLLARSLGMLALGGASLFAQDTSPVVDPPNLVNLYTSLGDWNAEGDQEGWGVANINSLSVSGGLFSGLTSGNDPQFVLGGLALDSSTDDFAIVEIRLRKEESETSRVDLFWGDGAGGFSGDRKAAVASGAWPGDGDFHVVQFPIGELFTGFVNAFRFDPNSDLSVSRAVDLDYVRIGVIAPDGDNDGLADAVETNTGIFVDRNDTGTDPADPDTDKDTFSDGVEVAFGTDPTNGAEFPEPGIESYSKSPVSYVVDAAITANTPTVANGTPTAFSIVPALPAGLSFNTNTGGIFGTPTTATVAADYTITASFGGGITDSFVLNLGVTNPAIVRYGVNPAVYNVDVNINTNEPVLAGPFPDSFSIAPELPAGLFFDTFGGTISGAATAPSPASDYVITAGYHDYPDASFTLSIRIKAQPELIGVDLEPLGDFVSLAEWNTDGDPEGWGFPNAGGTVLDGILQYETTAPDPQMTRPGFLDVSAGTILEIRLLQNEAAMTQFFWADEGGGLSEARSFRFQPEFQLDDGLFHTYQISFDGVFDGDVTFLRIDPGTDAGRSIEIDYIRLGSGSAPQDPLITDFSFDGIFQEVSITWTSTQNTGYEIESSPNLIDWTVNRSGITGDAGTTTVIIDSDVTPNYFRVIRED
jgi:hypothetical protein